MLLYLLVMPLGFMGLYVSVHIFFVCLSIFIFIHVFLSINIDYVLSHSSFLLCSFSLIFAHVLFLFFLFSLARPSFSITFPVFPFSPAHRICFFAIFSASVSL